MKRLEGAEWNRRSETPPTESNTPARVPDVYLRPSAAFFSITRVSECARLHRLNPPDRDPRPRHVWGDLNHLGDELPSDMAAFCWESGPGGALLSPDSRLRALLALSDSQEPLKRCCAASFSSSSPPPLKSSWAQKNPFCHTEEIYRYDPQNWFIDTGGICSAINGKCWLFILSLSGPGRLPYRVQTQAER